MVSELRTISDSHTFYATLQAHIELNDKDFEFLKERASLHYDLKVKSSVEIGGFLYGLNNRRLFSNGENKVLTVSSNELQTMMKAIEFGSGEHGAFLYNRFHRIWDELQQKQIEINKSVYKNLSV